MGRLGKPALLLAAFMLAAVPRAGAQPPPGVAILEPHETVELEHSDRRNRISRLSKAYGAHLIRYEEYLIGQDDHGLGSYPVDIPVLRVIFDQQVFFDFGRHELKPEAAPIIALIAESLSREPDDTAVFIAGHTDSVGNPDFNFNLGLMRAETVARELVARNLPQAAIYRVSFGEAVPVADNATEAGRAENRRVEFLFGARPEALAVWMEAQDVPACAAATREDMMACRRSIRADVARVELAMPAPPDRQAADFDVDPHSADLRGQTATVNIGREVISLDLSRQRRVVRVRN
jgi:OOP family OmpA-OmpF porin